MNNVDGFSFTFFFLPSRALLCCDRLILVSRFIGSRLIIFILLLLLFSAFSCSLALGKKNPNLLGLGKDHGLA